MQNSASQERSALFVATLTSFMGPFMISSVNVALPVIQKELGMNAVQLGWVATAYLLGTAMFLVPAGKVADIYGRKKVFTSGLVCYTLACGLAAFVHSAGWLIALRFFQGVGAALFVTTGMAIVTSIFPPQRRGRAIGIYVSAVYIGLSVGPFVGGLMTQHLGWRSLFMIMLLVGAAPIVAVRFLKGEWADAAGERLDVLGSVMYAGAIFALVYGATLMPAGKAYVIVAVGCAGIVAFVWRQKHTTQPVFDVSLFQTNHTFAFSSIAALIHYAATFAVTFLISLFVQYIKGLTPQSAGLVLVAQPVLMAMLSPIAGRLSDRIEPRLIASAGMAVTALCLAGFALLTPATPLALIICNLALLGFGFAMFSSPNMSAIMGAVEKRHYGIASGAVATMRLIGQMMSMAAATVVLSIYLGTESIHPATYPLFLKSTKTLFIFFALLSSMGVYFSLFRGKIRGATHENY